MKVSIVSVLSTDIIKPYNKSAKDGLINTKKSTTTTRKTHKFLYIKGRKTSHKTEETEEFTSNPSLRIVKEC